MNNHHYLFALKFRQFMLVNNIKVFSPEEVKVVAKHINKLLGKTDMKYSSQYVESILKEYGVTGFIKKYSKAQRHKLWFLKPLCNSSLKITASLKV